MRQTSDYRSSPSSLASQTTHNTRKASHTRPASAVRAEAGSPPDIPLCYAPRSPPPPLIITRPRHPSRRHPRYKYTSQQPPPPASSRHPHPPTQRRTQQLTILVREAPKVRLVKHDARRAVQPVEARKGGQRQHDPVHDAVVALQPVAVDAHGGGGDRRRLRVRLVGAAITAQALRKGGGAALAVAQARHGGWAAGREGRTRSVREPVSSISKWKVPWTANCTGSPRGGATFGVHPSPPN